MDAKWWEERGHWKAAQVAAPFAAVAETLSRTRDMESEIYDAFDPSLVFPKNWERVVLIFQLQDYDWTLLDSIGDRIDWDAAKILSEELATRALLYAFENTGGVGGYFLYENGNEIEQFTWGDTPEFEDSNREEKLSQGWQLSADNYRHLKSTRLTDIDMNADEIMDLPNRTAKDFGLYIPCDVWDIDATTGKFTLATPWTQSDLQGANLMLGRY